MRLKNLYQNRLARFIYEKTEKPIIRSVDWCGRHVGLTVIILLLIGMGLRVGYRGMVDRPERDELTYLAMIETSVLEDHVTPDAQRTLIFVGTSVTKLGGDPEFWLRCFNLSCSLLWLFMIFFLGKTTTSSSLVGLCCLCLATFNPYSIRLSGQVMREPLYLLIFTYSLFCAIEIVRGKRLFLYSALLGPLTILGVWSREEGMELSVLMPLALLFYGINLKRAQKTRQWPRLLSAFLLYAFSLGSSMMILCCAYQQKIEFIKYRIMNIFN
ncbi:MAG: hypothetical protein PHE09_06980 [Oscillospiraceae bacterium]|nr:hypothetical protein [Oscillospiraceae bacterium]